MERSGRVQLRVTGREKEEFTTKASAAGLGLSEYLRKAALEIGVTHKYDQAALHQLRKIGVNLNQIAHHLNAGNDLRGDVLISLRRCLFKLEKEIDSRQSPGSWPRFRASGGFRTGRGMSFLLQDHHWQDARRPVRKTQNGPISA